MKGEGIRPNPSICAGMLKVRSWGYSSGYPERGLSGGGDQNCSPVRRRSMVAARVYKDNN